MLEWSVVGGGGVMWSGEEDVNELGGHGVVQHTRPSKRQDSRDCAQHEAP